VTYTISLTATLLLASTLVGQRAQDAGPYLAGWRSITFANPYAGSRSIPCMITYPSKVAGKNTNLEQGGAPYPVLVFGHGSGYIGDDYSAVARHFASWGFLVVAPNTWASGPIVSLARDMQALTRIVRDEHTRSGSFLHGVVNVDKFGVAGHSMGGGASAELLGSSADVQAAVLLAPWTGDNSQPDPSEAMRRARVPFQVLVGSGDAVTPPTTNALPFYQKGASVRGMRQMVTLWSACDHMAIVGMFLNSRWATESYDYARRLMTAFMLAHLQDRDDMLQVLVGPGVHSQVRYDDVRYVVVDPNLYQTGTTKVGGSLDYHAMARANTVVLTYASLGQGSLLLPGLGILGLDPTRIAHLSSLPTTARQTLHHSLPVPNLSSLAGLQVWIQSAAANQKNTYRLTPTRSFTIVR
jgi:pimeloyl-ACP methyl ester carboxylesterase